MNIHKVKFFSARYPSDLESKINNFISESGRIRRIISVSYDFSPTSMIGAHAMVAYKEWEDEDEH